MWNDLLLKIKNELNNENDFQRKIQPILTNIEKFQRIHIFAIGKSSQAFWKKFKATSLKFNFFHKLVHLTLIDHKNSEIELENFPTFCLNGSHPIVSEKSLKATSIVIDQLRNIPKEDAVFFLISGGTSSLLEWPRPEFSLEQLIQQHKDLFQKGLAIRELNCERSRLSQVKSGGLLKFCPSQNIFNFIIDDTFDEDPLIVGSGPTIRPNVSNIIIDSATQFIQRASLSIPEVHWVKQSKPNMNPESLFEQAKTYQRTMVGILGEVSFSLPSNAPRGGRNSHLTAYYLDQVLNKKIQLRGFLSFATDGEDGPGGGAGAFFDDSSLNVRSDELMKALRVCESRKFLGSYNLLLPMFDTTTNIMDIRLFYF